MVNCEHLSAITANSIDIANPFTHTSDSPFGPFF